MAKSAKNLITYITIPKISDDCFLYFAEYKTHIPFIIRRIYHISGANPQFARGFHAHRQNRQILFCISGSIKITLDDGRNKQEVILDKPEVGLLIDKMIWHEMHEFKKNTILLVITSQLFDEKDYIRNYDKFREEVLKI